MKQHYFIKFDPRIKRFTGCDRATLILEKIEFFFSKQPNGFYKFIEPCSHRLYKKFDSWSEELGCDRKCFTRSWEKIAFRHKSRRAFNEAKDKFEGQLYASFYDRNRNQMFFIRNHELANETLKEFYKPKKFKIKKEDTQAKKTTKSLASEPLRNGHSGRSDKDVKMTPSELFKNNSHAEEIIKKMIEIWTALVEEGRGLVKLSKTTIPFLKKAFTDKFDSCLEKWRKFCYDIASSRFLMGEKNSFKAKLDWALLFKNIEKVLDGQYGIGDRTPKVILPSQDDIQAEILASEEAQEIKDFRILCLKTVGVGKYISHFKNLNVEFREEGEIALIATHKFIADLLEQNCYSYLRLILQGLGKNLKRILILAPGETRGRLIERERGGGAIPSLPPISTGESSNSVEFSMEEISLEDETLPEFSLETSMLREKLRSTIPPQQFLSELENIELEGINEDGMVIVSFEEQHIVEHCRVHFRQQILACVNELWQNAKYLIIQEKAEGLNGFEPIPFQNMLQVNQNIPGYKSLKEDADFLMNMVECKGKGAFSKDKSLPEVSLETRMLRTKLTNTIPPKQFPSWLGSVGVEDIGEDGTIVVAFDDQYIVDYCKVRFSQEIIQSATSLWKDVNKVVVRHKLTDDPYSSVEKTLKKPENVQGKSRFEQALQSLWSIDSAMKSVGALGTEEACPAFG